MYYICIVHVLNMISLLREASQKEKPATSCIRMRKPAPGLLGIRISTQIISKIIT